MKTLKKISYALCITAVMLVSNLAKSQTTITSIADGDWNDYTTWDSILPSSGDHVIINQNETGYLNNVPYFKLYTNFDYSKRFTHYESEDTNGKSLIGYEKEINGFNFSPALVFYNKKGNSSEIEISRLRYSNNNNKVYNHIDSTGNIDILSGNKNKQFELFLRYEYKHYMFKKKDWQKIKPIIGYSATPFVLWSKFEPLLSSEHPSSKSTIGLYLSVIPRIEYAINEKWYLDLNIPVSLVTSYYSNIRNDNPLLPINEKVENTFYLYNGPVSFAIRFGIGFKI